MSGTLTALAYPALVLALLALAAARRLNRRITNA